MKLHQKIAWIVVCSLLSASASASAAVAAASGPTSMPPLRLLRVAEAADPRAKDAVDLFFDLCVSTYVPSASNGDANVGRFEVSSLDAETAAKLSKGPIRSVRAKASDAMMLVSYEPQGLCMLRLASADETSVARAFATSVDGLASSIHAVADGQPIQVRDIGGMKATTRSWRVTSGGNALLVVVTTTPEDKGYVSQHVMTISYVR